MFISSVMSSRTTKEGNRVAAAVVYWGNTMAAPKSSSDVQNKHFVASSIKDLFDNVEAQNIIDFIKETRFYKKL